MTVEGERERNELTTGRIVVDYLLDCGCLQFGNWKFHSGIISPIKVEIDKLRANPEVHEKVCHFLARLIIEKAPNCNLLVAVPRGGMSIAAEISKKTGIIWRARPKIEGKVLVGEEKYYDSLPDNPKTVIVEDVLTKGGSSGKSIIEVRYERKRKPVLGVASIFSYGFVDNVRGVPVWPLCNFEDLIEAMKDRSEYADWVKHLTAWHEKEKAV